MQQRLPHAALPPQMLAVQVVRREVVAPDAVTLFVALPGKSGAPAPYLPGQFITLAIPTPTETLYRSYSLCGDGSPHQPWEITIKRVHKGRISNYLIDHVPVGSTLYISMPRGAFTLPQPIRRDAPLVFIAAGSGITPIRGMIRHLAMLPADRRPPVYLHYASSTPEDIIYRQEWKAIDPKFTWLKQWHYVGSLNQRFAPQAALAQVGAAAKRAHWYVCGPDSMRNEVRTTLAQAGVPEAQVHLEAFATQRSPNSARFNLPSQAAGKRAVQVTIQETGAVLAIRPNETVLEGLERHGYHPDFSCRAGSCGTCALRLLAGRVDATGEKVLPAAQRQSGYILSCIAHPLTDLTLLSGGRAPRGAARPQVITPTQRGAARGALRVALSGAVTILLFGMWQLTSHRPTTWGTKPPSASVPTSGNGGSGGSGGGAPTATSTPANTPTPVFGGYPVPDPVPGGGNGGGGNPTATPAPAATATPFPTPTDTPVPYQPPPQPTAISGGS